jgi:hypothetical protein
MIVELFDQGKPTGSMLMFQVKGRDVAWSAATEIHVRLPVSTLRCAESWIPPVLAVVCPVRNEPSTFAYLWLQE